MKEQNQYIEEFNFPTKEFIESVPIRLMTYSNTLIGIVILGALFLSMLIKSPVIVNGTAKITTVIPPEYIKTVDGGYIEQLLVSNGDIVSKNQILIVLRSDINYKDVVLMKKLLSQLSFREMKEPIKQDLHKDTEIFKNLRSLNAGPLSIELNELNVKFSEYYQTRNFEIKITKLKSLSNSKTSVSKNLGLLKSNTTQIKNELSIARQNEKRYQRLYEKGIVSSIEYENTKTQTLSIEQRLNNNMIAISNARNKSLLYVTKEKLTDLNYILERENKLINLRIRLKKLETAIELWETKYLILGRTKGEIHFLERLHSNSFINANKNIILIENHTDSLPIIAEITLSSSNYGRVSLNQEIDISLDSYPKKEFGLAKGRVTEISKIPNSDSNYMVIGGFPNGLKTSSNKILPFQEGLTGSCSILIDNSSLLERIFYSLKAN